MREKAQHFDPRQTMQADTFEVFHYRQPKPCGVEVHHHDFYEVYYLLDGQVEYWVEGQIIRMTPGDLLLINPMELHRPIVAPDSPVYERIVLWINGEFLQSMSWNGVSLEGCFDPKLPNLVRPTSSETPALRSALSELVHEQYSQEFGSQLYARGLLQLVLVQLNRIALHSRQVRQERQMSALVQQVLRYIADNLPQDISLDGLASEFFVSKYHLSHAFSREVGVSIYRYVMLRRLLMARQLLQEGMPAGQVCAACGFSDYTSFYRAFRAEYGISPGKLSGQ